MFSSDLVSPICQTQLVSPFPGAQKVVIPGRLNFQDFAYPTCCEGLPFYQEAWRQVGEQEARSPKFVVFFSFSSGGGGQKRSSYCWCRAAFLRRGLKLILNFMPHASGFPCCAFPSEIR